MGLTASQVKDLIIGLRSRGLEVGLRDVSFAVLSCAYGDDALAFRSTFGDSPEMTLDEYMAQKKIEEVLLEVRPFFEEKDVPDGISFDELKSGLIEDMRSLEALRDSKDEDGKPSLDPKELATVVQRIADIRVKLTDKFGTTERVVEQRVVVESKHTDVCPYCHHEFSLNPDLRPKGGLF